jgi:hypothetical protein
MPRAASQLRRYAPTRLGRFRRDDEASGDGVPKRGSCRESAAEISRCVTLSDGGGQAERTPTRPIARLPSRFRPERWLGRSDSMGGILRAYEPAGQGSLVYSWRPAPACAAVCAPGRDSPASAHPAPIRSAQGWHRTDRASRSLYVLATVPPCVTAAGQIPTAAHSLVRPPCRGGLLRSAPATQRSRACPSADGYRDPAGGRRRRSVQGRRAGSRPGCWPPDGRRERRLPSASGVVVRYDLSAGLGSADADAVLGEPVVRGLIAKFKIEIAMAYTVWDSSGHSQAAKMQVGGMHCWSAARGFSLTRKRPQVQILYRPQVTAIIRNN